MGAIRNSFKKFLGFDVEEQEMQSAKLGNYETKKSSVEEQSKFTIHDPDAQTFGETRNCSSSSSSTDMRPSHENLVKTETKTETNIFAKSKVKYEKPKTYGDACEIVEFLLDGYTVYVDVVDLELSKARRIVDFIDGAIFASGGDREVIKHKYFKFCPTYQEDSEQKTIS